jgi:hypothetical protein
MTLDEWTSLSSEARNDERRSWPSKTGPLDRNHYWHELLAEAAERFKREFGKHPLVNHIGTSAWFDTSTEPSILVTTALWPPQRIEELPDRYYTFGVVQNPILKNKDHYLESWTVALGELAGWSPEKVREWAREKWEDRLDGKDEGMIYHDEPERYIVSLLVPEELHHRLGAEARFELTRKLFEAICPPIGGDFFGSPLLSGSYDWEATRKRVKEIIETYAAVLGEERE